MSQISAILAINSGSSSLKFKLFSLAGQPQQLISGKITGIGSTKSSFSITVDKGPEISSHEAGIESVAKAADFFLHWFEQQTIDYKITGIGHRVVHGGLQFSEPEYINAGFLQKLKKLEPMAPLHLSDAIAVMDSFQQAFPDITQIACFDTYFHREMPFEAKHFALPRTLWSEGIIRYGFHGLSCQYIMEHLEITEPLLNKKKVIIAHLGSGCSMTAVKEGTGIDTTMGFSPSGGLIMNHRAGDLDPGIIIYLLDQKQMSVSDLNDLINHNAGLRAIAETDNSIRELLQKEKTDPRAGQAIKMFCYQAKKYIGALTAAMGGLDILVFTGGIGEHEPVIRERICEGLEFLNIGLDKKLNDRSASEISRKNKHVSIRVIPANEEIIIAKQVWQSLQKQEHQYNQHVT